MRLVFYFSFALFVLVLVSALQSCRKKAIYTTAELEGDWIRYSSNKPLYDSMQVNYTDANGGQITYTSPLGYFTIGQVKWKELTPFRDSTFKYKELGSDSQYYDGFMILSKNNGSGEDILYLAPGVEGDLNGNTQFWIRY